MDFSIPVDQRLKIKEIEKIIKYLDLARELKKLWNMKVAVIAFIFDALGKKRLKELEVKDRTEPIEID